MFRIRSLNDLMIYLDDVSFRDTGDGHFRPGPALHGKGDGWYEYEPDPPDSGSSPEK